MKQAAIIVIPLVILYLMITVIAPPQVDMKLNGVVDPGPYEVSDSAFDIYNNLDFIADLHCDALLWKRPMHERLERSHVDLVKLQQAYVSLQVFTVVSKTPKGINFEENSDRTDQVTLLSIVQGRPIWSWFNLKKRIGAQSRQLQAVEKRSDGSLKIIRSRADLEYVIESNRDSFRVSGALLGLEGAHPLKGRIGNVDYAFEKGVRMAGLVHFFDNELGGSAHGEEKGGLTDFGRECVRRFEELGIIVDLAHASDELAREVLAISRKPVVVSHTGVRGVCDRGRNLTDEQIRGVAATGGLIGIAFFEETMCGMDPAQIAKGIKYVRDLVGIEYAALGSDFDGAVTTPFDITGLPLLVDELLKLGFTVPEIEKVMGGNVRDLLLRTLPA